jgi:hypothetical protein
MTVVAAADVDVDGTAAVRVRLEAFASKVPIRHKNAKDTISGFMAGDLQIVDRPGWQESRVDRNNRGGDPKWL